MQQRAVRVAVVGAGPAGFFVAEALLKKDSPQCSVDLFERLPTPFGLVRAGVAPDHQKIKSVTKTFEKTAKSNRFRYFGNVTIGRDLTVDELTRAYDQVVFAVGSPGDRRLGIPGEELTGVHSGTAFVGWYNAHPDFREFPFDLQVKRAVVVGVGNVALDIARLLLKSPDELAKTDIAAHALAELRASQVREVVLVARRGPAQAAFTPAELADLIELEGVAVTVDRAPVEAAAQRLGELDAQARKNVELMLGLVRGEPKRAARTLKLQFNASPVELYGNEHKHLRGARFEHTALVYEPGGVKALGTRTYFELEAGLLLRSIGYFGAPLPGLPFDDQAGVIPNAEGRVTKDRGGPVLPGLYATGWIRRGPLGVIGTNKADAAAVAEKMFEDLPALLARAPRERPALEALLAERKVRATSYADWSVIDAAEVKAGQPQGKLREKFVSVDEMMNHLLAGAEPQD